MSELIKICESDDWCIDYDIEHGMYRVSYFEYGHFVNDYWFNAYKEVDNRIEKIIDKLEDVKTKSKDIMGEHKHINAKLLGVILDRLITYIKEL